MKRERIYCLLLAIITTILLWNFTREFMLPFKTSVSVVIVLMYLTMTLVIFMSGLGIIKNRKSKEDWFGLFVGTDGLIMMVDLILGLSGKIDESMKTTILIVFIITFLIFIILSGLWYKCEKHKWFMRYVKTIAILRCNMAIVFFAYYK